MSTEAPKPAGSGLKQRAVTAALLAPLAVVLVLFVPSPWFALALGLLCAFGLVEWARLIGWRSVALQALVGAIGAALMGAIWLGGEDALRIALLVGACWWPLAGLWLGHYSFGEALRKRNLTLKTIAGLLSVVPAWSAAVLLHADEPQGRRWVMFTVVLVWCADVFAYFAGRAFGRTKIAPRISPGKTRAGVVGALSAAAVYAAAAGIALDQRGTALALLVALALVTVAFSIVGDLFESLIKRHSKVKDSGTVFPGHGGVFDRLDSLFAALPVFVAGKLLLGL
jgi:phosphatidate cytidylyltransferase